MLITDEKARSFKESAKPSCLTNSSDDFLLIQAAFRKAGLPHELYHVIDGDQALAYLRREAPFEDAERFPFPDLMLLALLMPRMSGFDVLALLRERPDLR